MKKIYLVIAIVATLAACNSKTSLDTNKNIVGTDSTLYKNNIYTDTGMATTTTVPNGNLNAGRSRSANFNNGANTRTTTSNNNNVRTAASTTTSNSGSGAVQPARKRGMSHAAKNAIIGGVGGAIAGAIISKKHGKGAIIGGVIGAGGGYILGRKKDKKEGR